MASDAVAAKHGVASSTRSGSPAQLRDPFVAIGATVSIAAQEPARRSTFRAARGRAVRRRPSSATGDRPLPQIALCGSGLDVALDVNRTGVDVEHAALHAAGCDRTGIADATGSVREPTPGRQQEVSHGLYTTHHE